MMPEALEDIVPSLVALNAQIQALRAAAEGHGDTTRIDQIADLSSNILLELGEHLHLGMSARVHDDQRCPEDPTAISLDLYLGASGGDAESDVLLGEVILRRTQEGRVEPRETPADASREEWAEEWASLELREWAGMGLTSLIPEILSAAEWATAK